LERFREIDDETPGGRYFVAVEGGKSSWSWQIHRTSRPLGVMMVAA